jgi:ketopantoate reductase
MILPVLNGMRHMDVVAERFNPHNVVGCALKVATMLEDDGRIIQLTLLQDLAYGELDGTVTPRTRPWLRSCEVRNSTPDFLTRSNGRNGFSWLLWVQSPA